MTRHYIRNWGGLGNQLYILAFADHLARATKQSVYLYADAVEGKGDTRDRSKRNILSDLIPLIGLKQVSTRTLLFRLGYRLNTFCCKYFKSNCLTSRYDEPVGEHAIYRPIASVCGKGLLFNNYRGYYQANDYISTDFILRVKEALKVLLPSTSSQITIAEDAVAIHLRRGDFTTEENKKIFHTFGVDYYLRGLKYLSERMTISKVYVFSDDFAAIADEVTTIAQHYAVEEVRDGSVLSDLTLMSRFKHYVLANSTFSWWAARLSDYGEKATIIVPEHPHHRINPNDNYYPAHWVTLPNT